MRLIPATRSRFNKTLDKRIPMLKNLTNQLLKYEQIVTTTARADAIRPIVQMLIDNARNGNPQARSEVSEWTGNHDVTLKKLYGPLLDRYKDFSRDMGYTRAYSVLHREYAKTPMKVVELIDGPKDTLKFLQSNTITYDEKRANLFPENWQDDDDMFNQMVQHIKTNPRGRKNTRQAETEKMKSDIEKQQLMASQIKCKFEMEAFAKAQKGQVVESKKFYTW